ncbi:MAG: PDZ domain-containing protein, partial [Flavobacteriales bacterium]|nr:PDZ domain-containing protein [Flavobacteriales bacterium]
MDILIQAAQLFLSLAILVTLHEFGHFLPARLFKTRIEKFYLFFNPYFSLFRFKKVNGVKKSVWFTKESPKEWAEDENTTEWGLGWLPLGGYVKIAGMIDESMDTEQMKQPAQDWEFRSKKAWQRLIIMIGGVTVNLILGFLIYICVIFFWGQTQIKPSELKNGLSVHPYMAKYDIRSGDKVLQLDGKDVLNLDDLNKGIFLRDGRKLKVEHADGSIETIVLPKNVDSELFQAGAFPAFNLRSKANKVKEIIYDSPAQKAGLKEKDVILAVNAQPIKFFDDLQTSLYAVKGKKANLNVLRGKDTLHITTKVKADG